MRGPHPRPRARLILAHVGKTPCPAWRVRSIAAHPRSRGENGQESSDEGAPSGSSPLTRGKLNHTEPPIQQIRLIPAHAGKTHNATRVARLPGDHSQVGWLPPSCEPYHYPEKDSSPLKQGGDYSQADWTPPRVGRSCCPTRSV